MLPFVNESTLRAGRIQFENVFHDSYEHLSIPTSIGVHAAEFAPKLADFSSVLFRNLRHAGIYVLLMRLFEICLRHFRLIDPGKQLFVVRLGAI